MSSDKPRVSIGLPVFNGEKYLEEALDSILAQTFSDFELIISDNASTDRTQRICLKYAAKDSRIHYYRNERNLGASNNFNRVFKLSSGEYFRWAAYDDVIAPEFLQKCVSVLDQDPSIVLCYSKTGRINEHGALTGTYDYTMRLNSRKTHERFGDIINIRYPMWAIFGVIRKSVLEKTALMGNYIGSDRNLLAEIGLIGRMHEIPEYLLFRRAHPQAYSDSKPASPFPNYQEQMTWWTGSVNRRISFLYIRNFLEYISSVRRVPMKWSKRLLCYTEIAKWFAREGWIFMGGDVENALLCRSDIGRKIALTNPLRQILRRKVLPVVEKDEERA